jgi:fructokinase
VTADSRPRLVGGVEIGGTKVICAIGSGPDDLRLESRVPTTTPGETLARITTFFAEHAGRARVTAVGVAAFGPLDLAERSRTWGHITATTKPGWSHTDVAGTLHRALGVPVFIDTDVNGAALGEHRWGAGRGCDPLVYVTVGTGIGGGGVIDGRPMRGLVHPEMGHVRVPHDREADPFAGVCPFHGDCLEGLASGPAMRARWGVAAESLPSDHPAWALEARYLALGLVTIVCTLSPRRIVVGGGIASQPVLLPLARTEMAALLAGYVQAPALLEHIDEYVVTPALGERAGVLGAMALARDALAHAPRRGHRGRRRRARP